MGMSQSIAEHAVMSIEHLLSGPEDLGVSAKDGTTKARIERAALKLFARKGVEGVSIKEIAKACGISDGAMYRHFESKEALARQMFEVIHRRFMALVKAADMSADTIEEAVEAIVTAYCQIADADPALYVYHLTHRNHFLAASGDGGADPSQIMAARVRKAMQAGEIPEGDVELVSAMGLGVVLQSAEYRIFGRISGRLSDYIPQFTRAILAVLRQR